MPVAQLFSLGGIAHYEFFIKSVVFDAHDRTADSCAYCMAAGSPKESGEFSPLEACSLREFCLCYHARAI